MIFGLRDVILQEFFNGVPVAPYEFFYLFITFLSICLVFLPFIFGFMFLKGVFKK